jgi:hypothetical protein
MYRTSSVRAGGDETGQLREACERLADARDNRGCRRVRKRVWLWKL